MHFLKKGFSLWNCLVAGQILFLTCLDGFCPLINPVHMFQMAIVSALYFSSFTAFRGSWGLTFPLGNNVLFLHVLLVSSKDPERQVCSGPPRQRRAQQYWDLQLMKVHQRESTRTNRCQSTCMVLVFSQSSNVSATMMLVVYYRHTWLFTKVLGKAPALRAVQTGDCTEETKPPGETVNMVECCGDGAPPDVTSLWASLSKWDQGKVQEGMRDGTVCCKSPLHPVMSSEAFGSPIAIPSNAYGDGEVTQPRVIKQCACLSLSPFYSQ